MNDFSALYTYGKDLTSLARRNMLDPVLYREDEIDRLVNILLRRTKNNPILIGKAGVGKTAIVEGLATRITLGQVPISLQKAEIIALDLGSIVAGAKYRGAFEERIKQIIDEVKSAGNIIIFIDEIHTLIGAGRVEGGLDAANMLKPMLARGEFACIGATTIDEYREYIEKDTALERRFSKVMVEEPTIEQAIFMIRGLKERYELHHKLRIGDDAIQTAVRLAQRYSNERFLPDSAIDLIDEAASMRQSYLSLKPLDLRKLEERVFSLKVELQVSESEKNEELQSQLLSLEKEMEARQSQWQEELNYSSELHKQKEQLDQYRSEEVTATREGKWDRAAELKYSNIPQLLSSIDKLEQRHEVKINSVSSDDIAKVVAIATGVPAQKLIERDKQKFVAMEEFLASRIIGQNHAVHVISNAIRKSRAGLSDPDRPLGCFLFVGPTGVGKTELCRALANLLFDKEDNLLRIDMSEFSQEHNVSRLIGSPPGYVGYEKGGVLTEPIRKKPYQVVLCDEIDKAHPNVHSIFLQVMDSGRLTDGKGHVVNFKNSIVIMTANVVSDVTHLSNRDESIMNAVQSQFSPEFLNRLDDIVIFNTLNIDDIAKIVPKHFTQLESKLKSTWSVNLQYSSAVVNFLAESGYSPTYGARPLKYLFEQKITNPLTMMLLKGDIQKNETLIIDCHDNSKITLTPVKTLERSVNS